jgi:hypothetical protein
MNIEDSEEFEGSGPGNMLSIERLQDGRYRIGSMIVDDISRVQGAVRAVRRPITLSAVQIDQPFEVATTEGVMRGKAGDWLLKGVKGEVYICPDDVFRASYDVMWAT